MKVISIDKRKPATKLNLLLCYTLIILVHFQQSLTEGTHFRYQPQGIVIHSNH